MLNGLNNFSRSYDELSIAIYRFSLRCAISEISQGFNLPLRFVLGPDPLQCAG